MLVWTWLYAFEFLNLCIYPAQAASAFPHDGRNVVFPRGVHLCHDTRLLVKELYALFTVIGSYFAVTVAVTAEHLGIAHFLALYGAVDFGLSDPSAPIMYQAQHLSVAFHKGFELQKGLVLQVAGLVEDDEGMFRWSGGSRPGPQVHIGCIGRCRSTPILGGNVADQLLLGLHLRAVHIDGVACGSARNSRAVNVLPMLGISQSIALSPLCWLNSSCLVI